MSANTGSATKTPRFAWVILAIVFLASCAVPFNMFKVPPVAPVLMGAFGLDVTTFGWLMTAFTVVSIVLAFPAAGIVNKIGIKNVTMLALASMVVGSLIGTFSDGNPAILLFSRFVEGLGMGFFGVVAPGALTAWFPKKRLGLAIGVWSMWMPLGSTVMLNLAPALCGDGNWQAVWWAGTIYTVVVLVLFALFFRMPTGEELAISGNNLQAPESKQGAGITVPKVVVASLVLVGIAFMLDNITKNGSFNTYYPTFLMEVKGMDPMAAGFVTSITTFLGAAASPVSGAISDKIGDRKWMVAIATGMLFVAFIWAFAWEGELGLWFVVIVAGVFSSVLATVALAAVPEFCGNNPKLQNWGLATFACTNGIGAAIGGVALGWMVPSFGWALGSRILFLPILAVAFILIVVAKWDNRAAIEAAEKAAEDASVQA